MSVHSIGLLSEDPASVRILTSVFPLVLLLSCILGSYGSFFFLILWFYPGFLLCIVPEYCLKNKI